MAYIAPNSTIKLYANVPLDSGYTNELWFDSLAGQDAYFHGTASVVATLTNQYYQRATRNSLKVQLPVGTAYRCNYLAFRNTSFENKWFYAFVTNCEYVNNEVTEIFYEIDLFQSFLFDVNKNACFVEREHCLPAQDVIGNFILPEPVTIDEYIYDGYDRILNLSDVVYLVLINDSENATNEGIVLGNCYYGCQMHVCRNASQVNTLLGGYLDKPSSLLGIYSVPSSCFADNFSGQLTSGSDVNLTPETEGLISLANPLTFGSYTPLNKKLLTYPYSAIFICDSSGNSKLYRKEFFSPFMITNNRYNFAVIRNFLPPVSVSIYPVGYRSSGTPGITADVITISGFPEGCWTFDSASVYAEREKQNLPISLLAGVGSGAVGAVGAVATGAIMSNPVTLTGALGVAGVAFAGSAIKNVISSVQTAHKAKYEADIPGGTTQSNSNAFASGTAGFYGAHAKIPEENARAIDRFFSLYGYQTNAVKVPNFHSRSVFNYVKTAGDCFDATVNGKVNADDIARMNAILNNGLTFWHNPANVGNYTNEVLTANVN